MVLFDRSWYNRAGVERVMGFCNNEEYGQFLRHAPLFEELLVESGFSLTKLWFSVTQAEQRTRFAIRQLDPVRRWKLSPMKIESLNRGTTTPGPRRRCSSRPTPRTRLGRRSRATTRSGL